jgi:hypothetical protein
MAYTGPCDHHFVMPGLVPGIHVFAFLAASKTWMAGTSPAMTVENISIL